jgi:pimeloyl-ACP methyl ester carboxylesterase
MEIWPEAGHYPHLTEPDRFVRRLVAFDPAISG